MKPLNPLLLLLATLAATGTTEQVRAEVPIFADPSTFEAFDCVRSQSFSHADRDYGTIRGWIYRPVDGNCVSTAPPVADSPVVLLLNGAGYASNDYTHLAVHLAHNGFIVIAPTSDEPSPPIACAGPGVICIEDRARKGVNFLRGVQSNWQWSNLVQWDNISTLGHSRGGEAAIEAAELIRWEEASLGNPGVRAVISLAPTDVGDDGISGKRRLLGRESPAMLVVYGSRDEQISGLEAGQAAQLPFLPAPSGFALYDRVGREGSLSGFPISLDDQVDKSMHFVYRANHHQFSDGCGSSTAACHPSILACATQQQLTRGLVNAFLLWKVWGVGAYKAYFDGSVKTFWGAESWPQYSEGKWNSRRVIDNFQDGEVATSTLGGTLSVNGALSAQVVDNEAMDERSLHGPDEGQRLEISHPTTGPSNILQWSIPANAQNLSKFTHLSFRIGQGFGSEDAAQLRVRIRRAGSWSSLVSTAPFGAVPEPDEHGFTVCTNGFAPDRTVVHMRTIRIPLSAFGGDLSQIQNVQLRFDDPSTEDKLLYLDNLEFTGGTGIGL
jgi:hypothetical protein